jgi:hypothetical protein
MVIKLPCKTDMSAHLEKDNVRRAWRYQRDN